MRPTFLYDDAYITLASAEAMWSGYDPVFPGAAPLHGVTSPAHCLLVAALLPLLPPEWALLASCLVGAGVYGCGLWVLGSATGLPVLERAGLVVAGLGAGMISQHLVNGLETSWALATVTWLLAASLRDDLRLLGILAGTAPFVRPELAVLSVALLAWHTWTSPQLARRLWASALIAPVPWLLLMWTATGAIIPASLGAKRAWYAEGCWPASRRAQVVGAGMTGWLSAMPLVAIGAIGLVRAAAGRVLLVTAVVTLTVWATSVPNVLHSYQRHRYLAVFLPYLIYGLSRLPRWIRPALVGGAALMAVVSTASVVRFEPDAIARAMRVRTDINQALAADRATRVLLHDAGYLAFSHAMREGVDMVGLKTPRAMALHAAMTQPSCGQQRDQALQQLAAGTHPSHLVIWQPWDDLFQVTAALRTAGWRIDRLATIGAVEQVQVYRLAAPGK